MMSVSSLLSLALPTVSIAGIAPLASPPPLASTPPDHLDREDRTARLDLTVRVDSADHLDRSARVGTPMTGERRERDGRTSGKRSIDLYPRGRPAAIFGRPAPR